ncbi:MAG: AraC family transcriptional regulator [Chloroflexota bacterium]|jgi:AraC family transcriptional regulator|nr:AraC family transcriptional regulator [Chloroflexota bacterium]
MVVRTLAGGQTDFEAHAHAMLTVAVMMAGRVELTVAGVTHGVLAGECVLLNAGEVHAARATDYRFFSIGIAPELVDALMVESGLAFGGASGAFRARVARDPSLVTIVESLTQELEQVRPGRGPMLDALGRQLVVHLLREHLVVRRAPNIELSRAGPVDRRIRLAVELMHDNYARDLSLEEIATASYLSAFHFARLFKQLTGTTPGEYLANLRLERARELLIQSDAPIGEIARRVGYSSQSHFARRFKAVAGVSPRVYREAVLHPD